jgi:magnesium and cobalt transporter
VNLARFASLPLYLLSQAIKPVTWLFDHWIIEPVTRLVTGRRQAAEQGLHLTADELQAIVELAADEGVVGRDEGGMIGEVLRIHETRVREVMVPRVDMVACDIDTPTAEVVRVFQESKHKRLLIYRDNVDEIAGLVTARQVFLEPDVPVSEQVEKVHFVPEQQTVERLLKVFRQKKIQVAVVVDEYGGTAGLVTLEDCLEEIVGDIQDEYDVPEQPVERLSDHEFLLAADLSMRAWSEFLRTELDAEMRADTLGGFVTALLGRIPKAGDSCRWGNLRLTVHEVRGRAGSGETGRPVKVRVEVLRGAADELSTPDETESDATGQEGGDRDSAGGH